jgi:5-methylcytosine-specific restriction endonuclease McrA
MKAEPTVRDICGTESGYRKHRRTNEQFCSPCVEAHNIKRREDYTPGRDKKYREKYLARPGVKEYVREKSREYSKAKAQTPEAVARREERLRKAALRETNRFAKQKAYDELNAYRSAVTRDRKADLKIARAFAREQRQETAEQNMLLRNQRRSQEVKEQRKLVTASLALKKEIRNVITEAKRARWQEYLNRPIDHGTTYAEYHHCFRKNPGGACRPCQKIANERSKQWRQQNPERIRDLVRQAGYRRRMRKEAGEQVPYTRKEILERDDYCCHICGGKVDLTAPNQAGQSGWETYPHLDHVIPLSKGGPDTPDNVRTSHAVCNIVKSDKMIDTPEMAV